jgi:hypothetical protein
MSEEQVEKKAGTRLEITKEGKMTLTCDLSEVSMELAHGSLYTAHRYIDGWYYQRSEDAKAKQIIRPSGIMSAVKSAIWK